MVAIYNHDLVTRNTRKLIDFYLKKTMTIEIGVLSAHTNYYLEIAFIKKIIK